MAKNIVFPLVSVICFVLGGVFVGFFSDIVSNKQNVSNYSDIEFLLGEYHNKTWNKDNNQNVLDTEFVPDMESAVKIASVIFSNKQKQGFFKEYELQQVFYDKNDKVWIIGFWKPEKNGIITVGSDFNIAISQKNGEILKVWSGE